MKKLPIILAVFFLTFTAKAQEFESILKAKDNANILMQGYINPAMKGLMYGMNNGWATTAKTHKKLGFDITIAANIARIPGKDEVFTFVNSDLIKVAGGSAQIQTVMGEDTTTTLTLVSPEDDTVSANFEMPGGIKNDLPLNAVPTPIVQVGIGLPIKNTDLKVRYLPRVGKDDFKVELFGLGIQHDILQYFGPLDKLPLNVSLLAAFTNMSADYDIQKNSSISGTNQRAEFRLNTFTVQALASLDLKIINLYGGIGYNKGTSSLKMLGEYKLEYPDDPELNVAIQDPLDLNFGVSGMKATIGARLNLAFFKIFADYTLQEYNILSGGIAFSFR